MKTSSKPLDFWKIPQLPFSFNPQSVKYFRLRRRLPMSNPPLEALKRELFQTNFEYRDLVREHQRLETRIAEILNLPHPTPDELEEVSSLKRKKLTAKDRLEAILNDYAHALA
jgi:hypothetical protein